MLQNFNFLFCDAPEPWGLYFQDPASPMAEGIIELHDHIFYYLVIILTVVSWMLLLVILKGNSYPLTYLKKDTTDSNIVNLGLSHSRVQSLKDFNHGSTLEVIWTIIPAVVLVLIAFPSFKLLYLLDEVIEPTITVKTIGRQWYWTYEYADSLALDGEDKPISISFDSYLVPTDTLEEGRLRLLEVDNRVVLPIDTMVRFIVTAGDVLHSFAMPSLGIKVDAVPGRLNQTAAIIQREGVYYGQCSELCGVGHSMMPIVIEAVSADKYISWLLENNE